MKHQAAAAVVAAFVTSSYATDCYSCVANSGRGFFGNCNDASAIDNLNSCIASSSCNDADKSAAYQVIAQACANAGATVTAAPEATFSATSGGSNWPSTNWNSYVSDGSWQSWASAYGGNWNGRGPYGDHDHDHDNDTTRTITTTDASGSTLTTITTAPSPWASHDGGWRGGNGHGPFGGNNWGPWGSSGAWTSGPWTAWWAANGTMPGGCPGSTWAGWTSGSWSRSAPWTTWSGCTCSTTATATATSTVSGSVTTSVSYGIKVAEATSAASAAASATTGTRSGTAAAASATQGSGAAAVRTAAFGTLAAAFMGAVLLL